MSNEVILEMKHIDMRFAGIHALDDVSLTLRRGEVHALVGENGAGKSTLMKILIGLFKPYQGEIILNGNHVTFESVKDTQKAGISMIFQEFNQIKHMTVMENIFLGREPLNKFGAIDYKRMYKNSKKVLDDLNVDLDPMTLMRDLSVAKQQLSEIVKAVSNNSDIIIMDEPTSALSINEINYLFETISSLKNQGKTIVYISHKMEEIYGACDRVTVLRDGKFIHTGMVCDVSEHDLIKMMVDREITELFPKQEVPIGEVVLEVKGLTSKGKFENVSFNLRCGEILGLSGLMGAGRTEVIEAIIGSRKIDSGEIIFKGQKISNKIPGDAIKKGIAMVPEDRKRNGILLKLSVKENISMSAMEKCLKRGYISKKIEKNIVNEYIQKINIKCSDDRQICANLSGGNQQKVVVARVLNTSPDVLILDEPTRGIDVKTKSEIHKLMSELAGQGKAILMISSELPEIIGMSDRIVVLHEGTVTGTLNRSEATPDLIMKLAVGMKDMEIKQYVE